ncbi:MAG: chemosensory pili system protein ChpC [Flavobacteriales bacterium]|jgi:chemosensory pili system protein ChpC
MSDISTEVAVLTGDIPCLLLPLIEETLLVPTVTVAEMGPIQPFEIIHNTPDWFLGFYNWRNLRVPVISFETLHGLHSPKLNSRGRVAVLNNTGSSEHIPFISIITQDIPRMTRVEEKDINDNSDSTLREYDLMSVKVGLEPFFVPDIEKLEKVVLELALIDTK